MARRHAQRPPTGPTKVSPRLKRSRQEAARQRDEKELRVQRALAELAAKQHPSIAAAARANSVAVTTLYDRSKGRLPKKEAQAHLQSLSSAAEASLAAHITNCANGGFPLTPGAIHDLAETVQQPLYNDQRPRRALGRGWLAGFLLRHPELKSTYSRCLENARMKAVTVEGVRAFFRVFQDAVNQYQIERERIYNMDETGFLMGMGGRERVVAPAGPKAARFKAVPGNRESTTVLECVGSGGAVLAPMVIFKGKWHLLGDQRRYVGVEADWAFGVSANGWTSCDLAVLWLKHVFDPPTQLPDRSTWRLLVLDGHNSHVSVEFLEECWRRRIVPICLPPHSTHLMQPLDVSLFGPLTEHYRRQVVGLGLHADKVDRVTFVNMYVKAREATLTARAAKKAFADCGMTTRPDAEKILVRLPGYEPARTTPPPAMPATVATPANTTRFRSMLNLLETETSPIDRLMLRRKLLKAYKGREADVAILRRQDEVWEAAKPAKKTPKKAGDRKMLSKERMILRVEAELLVAELEKVVEKEEAARIRKEARATAAAAATNNSNARSRSSEDDAEGAEGEDSGESDLQESPEPAGTSADGEIPAQTAARDDNTLAEGSEAAVELLQWALGPSEAASYTQAMYEGMEPHSLLALDPNLPGPSDWHR